MLSLLAIVRFGIRIYGTLKKISTIILIGLVFIALDAKVNGGITTSVPRGQSLSQIGREPVGGCSFSVPLLWKAVANI